MSRLIKPSEELSPEQIEAIVNLQAITEYYNQDRALALLQINGWDVMVQSRKGSCPEFLQRRRQRQAGFSTPQRRG
jgi:hypothetical protein